MPGLHAIVKGRVQGVGYRYFVIHVAREIGLKGYVKNLMDGDVEVVAEGPEEDLEKLIKALWRGPAFSNVEDIDTKFYDDEYGYVDFQLSF